MGLLNALFGFLGGPTGVLAEIASILNYLFNLIIYVAVIMYNFVVAVGNFLLGIFSQVGKFLVNLWNGVIKGIFTRVLSVLQKAHDWLESHLRPMIKFLQRVRAYYDAIFLRYVKPILNALQHVRQVLAVLRALHINIGIELDRVLAQVEQRIAGTFLQIRAVLNNAVDLLNLLSDPTKLLRKPVLILSIRRMLPALVRAVTGRPIGYYFPSPRAPHGSPYAPVPINFNPRDPAMNPPASSLLGFDDGVGNVPPVDIGYTISVDAVDSIDALDWFRDDLWPAPSCADPAQCLDHALQLQLNAPLNA